MYLYLVNSVAFILSVIFRYGLILCGYIGGLCILGLVVFMVCISYLFIIFAYFDFVILWLLCLFILFICLFITSVGWVFDGGVV